MTFFNLKITLLFVLLSTGLVAQKFYVSLNGGYGFPIQTQTGILTDLQFEIEEQTGQINNKLYKQESVDLSLGKGFNFGGSMGFMFNENVGIDLGVSYLKGAKTTGSIDGTDKQIQSNNDVYVTRNLENQLMYSKMLKILPSFILTTSRYDVFNPYARLGLAFGFGSFFLEEDKEHTYYTGNTLQVKNNSTLKETFEGGMAFGVNTAVGFGYDFSEKFKITCEVNYVGMTYAPEKSFLTEKTKNGQDQLGFTNTIDKDTEYSDNFSYSGIAQSNNEPRQEEKITLPFSSIGVNFGIKYSF